MPNTKANSGEQSASDKLENAKTKALKLEKLADEKLAAELLDERNREAVNQLTRKKTP